MTYRFALNFWCCYVFQVPCQWSRSAKIKTFSSCIIYFYLSAQKKASPNLIFWYNSFTCFWIIECSYFLSVLSNGPFDQTNQNLFALYLFLRTLTYSPYNLVVTNSLKELFTLELMNLNLKSLHTGRSRNFLPIISNIGKTYFQLE